MATIPANNNTGLYNTSGTAAVVSNDITVSGNVNANNVNAVNTINAGTNITAGGNVTADYFIGDGSLLTNINAGNIVGSYGNANVAAYLASGSNSSNIVTSGNVSGTYILGDGSQLTGLPATYGNANVNAHLAAFGSNTINTTGNITAGYFIGDGSQLTGLPAVYGNANVAAFLPTYTGNLAGGNGAITNDLVVGGTIFGTFSGNISGNLVVPGSNTQVLFNNNGNAGASADFTFNDATNLLTVSGNVNATAFNGSGAGLTNLPGANVTGTVPLATAATTAGTVTTAAQPNITSVGTLTSLTTSGNVTVGGSLNSDDITSTGNVTVNGNQIITGNLTVQGTTTTINSNTITTNDKTITVANNQSTGALVDGAGLEAGNPAVATWLYDNASLTWKSSIGVSAVGNITGSYIFGNGSQLTGLSAGYSNADVNAHLAAFGSNTIVTTGNITGGNIIGNGQALSNLPGANVVGAVANATYATSAGTASSADTVAGANVTGTVANAAFATSAATATSATTAGTVTTNAQPNITSVGTLTSLGVSGNITTGGILTDGYYYANGTPVTFGGGSTYGNSNVVALLSTLGSNTISSTANITTTANVQGAFVIGNGSALSAITGANVTGTVANAAYATNSGTATSATTAGTVTNATQANITSVGTLTSLAVSGNTTSGNISVTGAVTAGGNIAGNFILGNGSQLTGIVSSYGNANVASYLASGTNSSNIITTANVVAGNINTTGASGNITGADYIAANFFVGNGSLLTGVASSYGDSNVATLLSGFGANTISTTGNITGGNILGNGRSLTGIVTSLAGNLAGNIDTGPYYIQRAGGSVLMGNVWVTGELAANTISAPGGDFVTIEGVAATNGLNSSGNINALDQKSVNFYESGSTNYLGLKAPSSVAADVVWTLPSTDGTSGQALSTYGNGVMYWSTGGGGGSPGGANTQIQFNNGGAFAGNAAMTFNNTTGNIGLGNLVINGDNLRDVNAINLNATPSPQRITVGTGYNGNFGSNVDPFFISRGGTFAVIDKYNIGNADTNMAQRLTTSTLYADMGGATLTNNTRRMQSLQGALFIGNGTQQIASGPVYATATGLGGVVAVGNISGTGGSVIDMGGTATVSHIAGAQTTATIGANANVGNAVGMLSVVQTFTGTSSNTTSAIGFLSQFTGVPVSTVAPTNVYGFYMPGTTATHGVSNANNWRRASNYYFLRNDDPVAQNQLGSLRAFHEFEHATATSGSITINKNDGQVQNIVPTGNVTISGYSNFVVTASDGTNNDPQVDTVTIIVEQGATPYTITMPTGAAFKYAGGANTVPATANAVVMISVTAANIAGTTTYLTTISPEFS